MNKMKKMFLHSPNVYLKCILALLVEFSSSFSVCAVRVDLLLRLVNKPDRRDKGVYSQIFDSSNKPMFIINKTEIFVRPVAQYFKLF